MEIQNIALFGPATHEGQRILHEALLRGHKVTAFVTDKEKIRTSHARLKMEDRNVKSDTDKYLKGYDVVINAYNIEGKPHEHLNETLALVNSVKSTGIKRIIALGYPGTREVEPAILVPTTAEEWKAIAETQMDILDYFENEKDICWSYIHYPEVHDAIRKNSKPVLGMQMLAASSVGGRWFHAEKCAENIVNEVELLLKAQKEFNY
jgi:putative NADH-flavin reductase